MLFLFIEHAFDVGDFIELDTVMWKVKQIGLMYTTLVKGSGERYVGTSNKALVTMSGCNVINHVCCSMLSLQLSCASVSLVAASKDANQSSRLPQYQAFTW